MVTSVLKEILMRREVFNFLNFVGGCGLQMLLERQRIEASPNPVSENFMPPPPSYEEASGFFVNSAVDGAIETVEYFLAEVIKMVCVHLI